MHSPIKDLLGGLQGRVWLEEADILNDRMKCADKSLTALVYPFLQKAAQSLTLLAL